MQEKDESEWLCTREKVASSTENPFLLLSIELFPTAEIYLCLIE